VISVLALTAVLFWIAVFLTLFGAQGTASLDFLLGRYEELPSDLGVWSESGVDERTGLVREERYVLPGENMASKHLFHQVRYRNPETRSIVSTEPERKVLRARRPR
jgi:hypothetical protein